MLPGIPRNLTGICLTVGQCNSLNNFETNCILFRCVPGYVSIKGNESVDKAAEKAYIEKNIKLRGMPGSKIAGHSPQKKIEP